MDLEFHLGLNFDLSWMLRVLSGWPQMGRITSCEVWLNQPYYSLQHRSL